MKLQEHFEQIRQLIRRGQGVALQVAYTEQLKVYWHVGAYVYYRVQADQWGEKTVEQLANWLTEKDPALKGFSKRSLYRMQEFYLVWHEVDWDVLKRDGLIVSPQATQFQHINNQSNVIFRASLTQVKEMPGILAALTWSHHIELLGKSKTLEEKIFYLLLCIKEKYAAKELRRHLNSGLYERQKLTKQQIVGHQHPNAGIIPQIFRDKYIFEFLDLPELYSENDLKKGLFARKMIKKLWKSL